MTDKELYRLGIIQRVFDRALLGRALRELAIELICANSSQAKGRVERVNKTLQDRLIKEMRLQNISSVAEANQWIEHFMSDFNRRFSRPAKYPKDLHLRSHRVHWS